MSPPTMIRGALTLSTLWAATLFSAAVRGQTDQRADDPQTKARDVRQALLELQDALRKAGRMPQRPAASRPAASNALGTAPKQTTGLVPLTELGASLYQGKAGGLYPEGSNDRPEVHEQAGLAAAQSIRPLDAQGKPAASGKIVLLSIGMSNTTQEFSTFKRLADADPDKNPAVVVVDGAQGGMTAATIVRTDSPRGKQFWDTVSQRLERAGATPEQVQIAWVKEADAQPTAPFPEDAQILERELAQIAALLKDRFPNIRIAYCSSRIYAGYATTRLNPEPFAYQSGFAVKWLIERQIQGDPALNHDPKRGTVKAPWLAWGPYLWADGLKPRRDGLTYEAADFAPDGTHPAPQGAREKVAKLLLAFFKADSTARSWFVAAR